MAGAAAPELRERLNAARFRAIGALLAECQPGFDAPRFAALASDGLESLTLLQRLRHGSRALHATLPPSYPDALAVLRILAPKLADGLAGLMLPDYVGEYGHGHFVESMDALEYLTRFSSAEFAIREFLRRDLDGTLVVMERWSRSPDEHVRRLVSEGSRPLLPWGGKLPFLLEPPFPTLYLLDPLCLDPSDYVRLSVSNHLNDLSKAQPAMVLATLTRWRLAAPDDRRLDRLARHACRTLLKDGHPGALEFHGYGQAKALMLETCALTKSAVALGGHLEYRLVVRNTSRHTVRVMFDYAILHRKANGGLAPKVFKGRTRELSAGECWEITGRHVFRRVTTRVYHAGGHVFEVRLNGKAFPGLPFELDVG